jgi:hypothetical protein
MITVGAVVGGPECAFFEERVRKFMRFCRESFEAQPSPSAEVNLVFHLPGSIAQPGYTGVRRGRLSKAEKTLMIQVGVEEDLIRSTSEAQVERYIFDVADEAIATAKSVFDQNKIEYSLETDRHLLDRWLLNK